MDILAHIDSRPAGCHCIATFKNRGEYYFFFWFTDRKTQRSRSFFGTRPRETIIVVAAPTSLTRLCAVFLFANISCVRCSQNEKNVVRKTLIIGFCMVLSYPERDASGLTGKANDA